MSVKVEVFVEQVPAPVPTGPAAPTHLVTVTVEILELSMVPVPVTKFVIVTVQAIPCPPTLLAVSLLHCEIGGAMARAVGAVGDTEVSTRTASSRTKAALRRARRWVVSLVGSTRESSHCAHGDIRDYLLSNVA
jgi:hypothetical protein